MLGTPQKIAILGDMLELGVEAKKEHKHIQEFCRTLKLNVFYVGTLFNNLSNKESSKEKYFVSVDEINAYLQNNPLHNTLILIKGSRKGRLEDVKINNL